MRMLIKVVSPDGTGHHPVTGTLDTRGLYDTLVGLDLPEGEPCELRGDARPVVVLRHGETLTFAGGVTISPEGLEIDGDPEHGGPLGDMLCQLLDRDYLRANWMDKHLVAEATHGLPPGTKLELEIDAPRYKLLGIWAKEGGQISVTWLSR